MMETRQDVLRYDKPMQGPSSVDEEAWHEMRRQGVSATQAATLAKGYGSDKRRLLIEKITGERADLTGNRYIDRGNAREPIIAEYVWKSWAIAPNKDVYSINDGRYLATPDGIDWSADVPTLLEIKTSKYNLDPGDPASHFSQTTYYDQMQWAMFVLHADECLFVWEQHDDNWPDPQPLYDRPRHAWISRDNDRIDHLIEVADQFLLELEAARVTGLPPVSDLDPVLADAVHALLQARDAEAVAKARKEAAWQQIMQMTLLPWFMAAGVVGENDEAKVTLSHSKKATKTVDVAAMEKGEPEFWAAWQKMRAAYDAVAGQYEVETVTESWKPVVTAKKH